MSTVLPSRKSWATVSADGRPLTHRIPVWLGDLIVAILVIMPETVAIPGAPQGSFSPAALTLAIAAAGVLPFRRRWPFPVLAATIALFVAAAVLGELSPTTSLPVAIAVFGMVTRVPRRVSVITTSATIVILGAAALLSESNGILDPRVFQPVAVAGFAAALADGMRSRRAYIMAITDRALRAEQTRESEARRRVAEERLRIARDLHDVVAHQIAVINLHAGVASAAVGSRPEDAERSLATIRAAARTVLGEIGDLLALLRASTDETEEAPRAPLSNMDRLEDLLKEFRRTGLEVTLRNVGTLVELPAATGVVAYRVIQEALTNAHKHGSGHRAHLLIEYTPETINITVTNPVNNGPGPSEAGRLPGHGLLGIAERVESVRGTFQTTPAGVNPFRLQAQLPLPASSAQGQAIKENTRNGKDS
ncbi:sensor histidine kinase [Arthrobacter sp. ISL-48]|uniref:sensor histidine kinase n=1 Tax=Arthrobacter sp. ISL-48 TaxID=2819110 RepID=UPI001BE92105|nr:histidine kinase [Arthrobacter sp. ISL-48]MBT2534522.1 sensor histidine kinase [Arthrobacter sp. ISL-48]